LFAPLARGSVVLVRGGMGVGRNVLLAELAELARRRGEAASVWVLWEREAWSEGELEHLMRETAVGASIRVLTASSAGPGGDAIDWELPGRALQLCDALLSAGQRHVQLTFFERRGVRSAIEAVLPALATRRGRDAITTFIVPPWQLASARACAPFDVELAFSPQLARARCFPALDPEHCASRVLDRPGEHARCARDARAALALLARDAAPVEPAVRARAQRLRAYLTQPFHVAEPFSGRQGASVPLPATLRDVRRILTDSAFDFAPEQLGYRGALDD
jgi:F0F1-type ATP synthase beta subunit